MATSAHTADDDRIFYKEARTLVRGGADVVILCSDKMKLPENTDGVRFAPYHGGGSLRQRLSTIGRLTKAIDEQQPDVVHCHEPDGLIAALRVGNRKSLRVIFDSHEMWGGVAAAHFPRCLWRPVEAGYKLAERRYLKKCSAAIGASGAISEYLAGSVGEDRVVTLLNVPVPEVFREGLAQDWGETTVLCHDGHLTFTRGLKVMLEAVRLLAAQYRVVFKIVGDVFGEERAWLESFVAKYGLASNVVRTGWLPYEDVGQELAPCHIGLVCLAPKPNHWIAAPNKCFNYLLYGLPVVGPDFPRSHFAVLEREGCAVLADPSCAESYAAAVAAMIDNRSKATRMAARARLLSETKYRWQHMEPLLLGIYRRILGHSGTNDER
jgi:glycosyltransferase involved in cell wall biosynthesis